MANKDISLKTLGVIGSFLLLFLTVFGLWYLWSQAQVEPETNYLVDPRYKVIEIESVKKEAEELIKDRSNLSGMPVKAPTEAEVGRENPFAPIE